MFLLRAIFWLGLAFFVIVPQADFDPSAAAASAVEQGRDMLTEQLLAVDCPDIACEGGRALLAVAVNSTPSVGSPMQDSPTPSPVPLPRPRPAEAG